MMRFALCILWIIGTFGVCMGESPAQQGGSDESSVPAASSGSQDESDSSPMAVLDEETVQNAVDSLKNVDWNNPQEVESKRLQIQNWTQILIQSTEVLRKDNRNLRALNEKLLENQKAESEVPIEEPEVPTAEPPRMLSAEQILSRAREIMRENQGELSFLSNTQEFRFVYVPPGTYSLGLTENSWNTCVRQLFLPTMSTIRGVHEVTMKQGFFIQKDEFYEMRENDKGKVFSWSEAQKKIKELNTSYRSEDFEFRLPTEIEWECAAKGMNPDNLFPWQDNADPLNAEDITPLGVQNLASSVGEWCMDVYKTNMFNIHANKEVDYYSFKGKPDSNPGYRYKISTRTAEEKISGEGNSRGYSTAYVWRGATDLDVQNKRLFTRVVSYRRSAHCNQKEVPIGFRLVLLVKPEPNQPVSKKEVKP